MKDNAKLEFALDTRMDNGVIEIIYAMITFCLGISTAMIKSVHNIV